MIRERTKKIPLTEKIENFGCHFQTGCMIVVPHVAFLFADLPYKPCLHPPSQPPKIAYYRLCKICIVGDVHIMANVSHTKISIACKMASIHVGAGGVL